MQRNPTCYPHHPSTNYARSVIYEENDQCEILTEEQLHHEESEDNREDGTHSAGLVDVHNNYSV